MNTETYQKNHSDTPPREWHTKCSKKSNSSFKCNDFYVGQKTALQHHYTAILPLKAKDFFYYQHKYGVQNG